ncbi:MAG: tRNA 4-thiouridine(8) synthase ThiI [Thermoprotei archaeon]|nr:MAG: tRNA 4-thiouridine(8) synthase ThiI [Thermoprotei archaeon]
MKNVIILRLGEITIKSKKVRKMFENILLRNINRALASEGLTGYKIRKEGGRIFVYVSEAENEKAINVLRRVFGITSLSHAYECYTKSLNEILQIGERLFKDKVKGKKFAVRARRVGAHDFTSLDVEKELGSTLLPYSEGVDLVNPDVTVFVEIRDDRAYFFDNIVRCYGGLPIGVEGKVVALVSGGYDSIVAAWFLMKRGAEVHYVFCNLGGAIHEAGALSVIKVLADKWSYGYEPLVYVVDFREILSEIRRKCDPSLITIILKRFMYRVAEEVAEKIGAEAIVTGESLGQVSSQTLRNLYVSSLAIRMPILRPLIGLDKEEIVSLAREIGTYDASSKVREYCGAFSEHPKTHSELNEVLKEEAKIDMKIYNRVLESLRILKIREISITCPKGLEIEIMPRDALIIDLGSGAKLKEKELNLIKMSFDELLEKSDKLDRNKTYILVCDQGGLSLEAAKILRDLGLNAYSLRGGYKSLRKYKEKS